MFPIRPIENQLPIQPVENTWKNTCIGRVWTAVVEFFTVIATTIANGLKIVWNFLREVFCHIPAEDKEDILPPLDEVGVAAVPAEVPAEIAPANLPAGSLREKLELYRNMPRNKVDFVERSITIFQDALRREEEAKIGAHAGVVLPPDQLPLTKFNEDFEGLDPGCFVAVASAVVKAYTFSNTDTYFDFFQQRDRVPAGPPEPEVRHPITNDLIHAGGQQFRNEIVNRSVRLRELRALFNALPPQEKEIIIDKTDFDHFDQLEISVNGKTILRDLAAMANKLQQNNGNFMEALQAAHQRKFPG